jgi:hypothetical protein
VTTSGAHAPEIPGKNPGTQSNPEPGVGPISTAIRAEILTALERAGWQLDSDEPHVIEASDGERYGLAVFFEGSVPVEICYGDGVEDLQHSEDWAEAPGIFAPEEVARLFSDEEGEQE